MSHKCDSIIQNHSAFQEHFANKRPIKASLSLEIQGVKRNNGVFIIPLFLLKNFRYSIIPAQKVSLFHYSCPKISIIPLFLPKKHTLFHYSKNKISVILIPLFLDLQPPTKSSRKRAGTVCNGQKKFADRKEFAIECCLAVTFPLLTYITQKFGQISENSDFRFHSHCSCIVIRRANQIGD